MCGADGKAERCAMRGPVRCRAQEQRGRAMRGTETACGAGGQLVEQIESPTSPDLTWAKVDLLLFLLPVVGSDRAERRARYAMCGTEVGYAATRCCCSTPSPRGYAPPSAYARATRCPVLTARMLLPGRGALLLQLPR
eukprot:1900201-Rhodomonas_salina.2